jgi:hypothetical protein
MEKSILTMQFNYALNRAIRKFVKCFDNPKIMFDSHSVLLYVTFT